MLRQRTTPAAARRGNSCRTLLAIGSSLGTERTYDGVRWSMVTCLACLAIVGTSVTAVAPEPMTTTDLPARSRPSGQDCGCTTWPSKSARPGNVGA